MNYPAKHPYSTAFEHVQSTHRKTDIDTSIILEVLKQYNEHYDHLDILENRDTEFKHNATIWYIHRQTNIDTDIINTILNAHQKKGEDDEQENKED